MAFRWKLLVAAACVSQLIAGDDAWRDKKVADWTEQDAKQVLKDSPWVKTVTPEIERTNTGQQRRGGMSRGGSIGIGIPGIGIGRRGGMGGGGMGGGYP